MPLSRYTSVDDLPASLQEALATHGILTAIGFDSADIFINFSPPSTPEHQRDYYRVTVHLRASRGLPEIAGKPLEFIIDAGLVLKLAVDEQTFPELVMFYNQLTQEQRDHLCRLYYSDARTALLMSAIERKGFSIPIYEGNPTTPSQN